MIVASAVHLQTQLCCHGLSCTFIKKHIYIYIVLFDNNRMPFTCGNLCRWSGVSTVTTDRELSACLHENTRNEACTPKKPRHHLLLRMPMQPNWFSTWAGNLMSRMRKPLWSLCLQVLLETPVLRNNCRVTCFLSPGLRGNKNPGFCLHANEYFLK